MNETLRRGEKLLPSPDTKEDRQNIEVKGPNVTRLLKTANTALDHTIPTKMESFYCFLNIENI